MPQEEVTAGLLVIGDEILSGRTKDKNIGFVADHCNQIGIRLKEIRVVADDEAAIIGAVNELRRAYTYVFTTGGIGPTHDDITADSVARAFGVPIDIDPRAVELLRERYAEADLTGAAAHGPHPRRSGIDRELRFEGPRLQNRQCYRYGRRTRHHGGDASCRYAKAEDRAKAVVGFNSR